MDYRIKKMFLLIGRVQCKPSIQAGKQMDGNFILLHLVRIAIQMPNYLVWTDSHLSHD